MRITDLTTPLGEGVLVFRQLEGDEGINKLFSYTLLAHSIQDDISPDSILGKTVTVSVTDQFGKPVYLNAVVAHFKRVGKKRSDRHTEYEAILAPWLWLATHRSDCKIYENQTAFEIIATVLSAYPFTVSMPSGGASLPKLAHVVQYNESDFAFVSRLMETYGINYRFAHSENNHTLVLSKSVAAFGKVPGHESIPFLADAEFGVTTEELINSWTVEQSIKSGSFSTSDYDYRGPSARLQVTSLGTFPKKNHNFSDLPVYHWQGQQHYADNVSGERLAELRQNQQEQEFVSIRANSNVRGLALGASGLRFTLCKHPDRPTNQEVAVLSTHTFLKENPGVTDAGEHTEWRTSFTVTSSKNDYKPNRLTPHPSIPGVQTAIVVGPEGQEIWVNDLGQIKIRLWWDRNTPDGGWQQWVRVSSSWAGNSFGEVMLPRVGDEVIVTFLDGNPAHPIVTGRVVNANRPPAPFSGQGNLPANYALAGLKSRELEGHRYGQLLFDDTTGEISSRLQSEHAKTQLNLGFLTHPRNGSANARGEGFELRTDAWGALRADKGLLLTTDGKLDATGNALSREELIKTLEDALKLAKSLSAFASDNKANASDSEPQEMLSKVVKDWGHGSNVEKGENGGHPVFAVSSPAGIALGTPLSTSIATGQHIDLVAQQNQHHTAGQKLNMHAGEGISQFAKTGGIKSIAYKGPHITQAQDDDIQISADKSVVISASNDHVMVSADKHITLTSGGAYIKLADGNIDIHCPGKVSIKGANHAIEGPTSLTDDLIKFNTQKVKSYNEYFHITDQATGEKLQRIPYRIHRPSTGEDVEGKTEIKGRTELAHTDDKKEPLHLFYAGDKDTNHGW